MPERPPAFSVSQITTFRSTFRDDVRAYADAGFDGIGIWELKLPAGGDAEALELLDASGLGCASAVAAVPSILPLPLFAGPLEPAERVESICASLHRLAPFRPSGVVCFTGPAGDDPDAAREIVVDGLRTIADEAEAAGVRVGFEPFNRSARDDWSFVTSLPEAVELVVAADRPALGIQFDTWQLWNTESLLADIERECHRFVGVHVADWREPTRSWADRVLPGDGVARLPAILGALEAAGWDGFYDLEIFSDDGSFGNAWPDSLWAQDPGELLPRAAGALREAWDGRIRRPAEGVTAGSMRGETKEEEA